MRLQLEKFTYYRLKSGQTAAEAEKVLNCPVNLTFGGAITEVTPCREYFVRPFDTYAALAIRYGVEEGALRTFNGNRVLYPGRRVFIPVTP